MATSAWRPLAVAHGGSSTLGGGAKGLWRCHEKRRRPPQDGVMRCRSAAPETKRCAVGPQVTMRCRSAHTVRSFEESHLYDPTRIAADLPRLLELIGKKRVGDRPDRYEPRAVKRRPKPYPRLKIPRRAAKRLIKRGLSSGFALFLGLDKQVVSRPPCVSGLSWSN